MSSTIMRVLLFFALSTLFPLPAAAGTAPRAALSQADREAWALAAALFQRVPLPAKYRKTGPLRCANQDLMPLLSRASPETRRQIMSLARERPVLSGAVKTQGTEDGFFLIHYTLEGRDAISEVDVDPADGIPDYVNRTMEGLMESRQAWVVENGWRAPLPDGDIGGDTRLDVYIRNLEGSYFGLAHYDLPNPDTPNNDRNAFISLNVSNDIIIGARALKSVAAHEFHHTIQVAYDAGEQNWIYETTATYMQLDYYEYNKYIPYLVDYKLAYRLGNPELSLLHTDGTTEYANSIWLQYLVDSGSPRRLIRELWEEFSDDPGRNTLSGLDALFQRQRGTGFELEFRIFSEWNYFLCTNDDGHHYFQGANCGSILRIEAAHNLYPVENAPVSKPPHSLGSNYIELLPDFAGKDLTLSFKGKASIPWGLSILLLKPDCNSEVKRFKADHTGEWTSTVTDYNQYRKIVLIVQNLYQWNSPAGTYTYSARTSGVYTGETRTVSKALEAIKIHPDSLELEIGAQEKLTATGIFADCHRENLTERVNIIWRATDNRMIEVKQNGELKALARGTTEITAQYDGIISPAMTVVIGGGPLYKPSGSGSCQQMNFNGLGVFVPFMILLAAFCLARARNNRLREKK